MKSHLKKVLPAAKKPVFRASTESELPPDNENWSPEAFLHIITKKQTISLKNMF